MVILSVNSILMWTFGFHPIFIEVHVISCRLAFDLVAAARGGAESEKLVSNTVSLPPVTSGTAVH